MNNPMCVAGTPVEHYPDLGLWVKREDLCCPGGPNFSKTRGVYAHVKNRDEKIIGVLDTSHSQGGWAVARACEQLGKVCYDFFPVTKAQRESQGEGEPFPYRAPQRGAREHGAILYPLQAGRSAVLYHQARAYMSNLYGGYMMPNALKLPEMISETVAEVLRTPLPPVGLVVISASSGTIAAGVISGLCQKGYTGGIVVHQGYSRSAAAIRGYMSKMVAEYSNREFFAGRHPAAGEPGHIFWREDFDLVDENYAYADTAMPGVAAPFPCNEHYDLKALRWWRDSPHQYRGTETLLWNIG